MTAPIASGAQATCNTFAQKASRLRWWYIAAPLLIVAMVGQLNKVAVPVVMSHKQFLHDLNLLGRPAVTGLLMSGFLFSYAIFQFVWGYTVRRFGPRVSAITGILIWGGTMLLSGIAETASALLTARIILGIGGVHVSRCQHFCRQLVSGQRTWPGQLHLAERYGPWTCHMWGSGGGCHGRRELASDVLRTGCGVDTKSLSNISRGSTATRRPC
jgi:hypothetical protein